MCCAGSKRRARLRKRQVQSGHSAELRPLASMYQLAQPVFQTVSSILASSSRLYAACASGVTSTTAAPRSRMARSAPSSGPRRRPSPPP
jgi:hypothetical protein